MPEMSGVELAGALRRDGWLGHIVFITTSRDYAPESYQVKAFSYILKPACADSISDVLHELDTARKAADTNCILVKTAGETRRVLLRDISHIEIINQIVRFRLTDGSELDTRSTLSETAPGLLGDSRFIQCHRSYIVNMNDVDNVQGNAFITRNGKRVPISRNYADAKRRYFISVSGGDER